MPRVERVHPAFALNGLEHDGADLASKLGKNLAQLINVVGRACHEPARERTEGVLQAILHGGGKRLERAAVKAAAQADDCVPAVAAPLGIQARKLHGALVGLGSRIGEEGFPNLLALLRGSSGTHGLGIALGDSTGKHTGARKIVVSKLGKQRRDLAAMLDVEVIRYVHELLWPGARPRRPPLGAHGPGSIPRYPPGSRGIRGPQRP